MDEKLKFPYLKLSDGSQMDYIKSLLEMFKKGTKYAKGRQRSGKALPV